MGFVESLLCWLSASGVGIVIGWFVNHKFALQREEKQHKWTLEREEKENERISERERYARNFAAKKEAYKNLTDAMYEFAFRTEHPSIQNVGVDPIGSEMQAIYESKNAQKDLQKAMAEVRVCVPIHGTLSKLLKELETFAAIYRFILAGIQESYLSFKDGKPTKEFVDAMNKASYVSQKFKGIQIRLLEAMQKDLGVE